MELVKEWLNLSCNWVKEWLTSLVGEPVGSRNQDFQCSLCSQDDADCEAKKMFIGVIQPHSYHIVLSPRWDKQLFAHGEILQQDSWTTNIMSTKDWKITMFKTETVASGNPNQAQYSEMCQQREAQLLCLALMSLLLAFLWCSSWGHRAADWRAPWWAAGRWCDLADGRSA